MYRTLTTIAFLLLSMVAQGQNVLALVIGSVTDSSGNPVAGHPVTLTATPTPGTSGVAITAQLITSANGYFGDSLLLPGVTGTLVLSTADCNGATLSNTFSYSPNSGSVMTVNSPFVLCAGGSGGGGGAPLTCDALFLPDSNQVLAGLVHLVNACTSTYTGPAATTTTNYAWTFGDGGTATGAYPNHYYSAPGTYGVCVTMATTTSNGYGCTDTYCDSITIDSTGFMVFKTQAGFTLQVIDASQLRTAEFPALELRLSPNPASSGTPITWSSNASVDEAELLDLQGSVLRTGTSSLATEGLPAGIYVVRARTPWGPIAQRIVLTH